MNFIESTIEEPIGFFEDYFHKNGIKRHYQEFIDWCIKEENKSPSSVKVFIINGDCIIHRSAYNYNIDDSGAFPDTKDEFILTDTFSSSVDKMLKSEYENSKILLKDSSKIYLSKFNDNTKFLSFQKSLLDEILKDCSEVLKEFPYCVDHLNTLSQYIQDLSNNNLTIKMDLDPIFAEMKSVEETEDIFDPIDEILGYLNGNNENGRKIMSKIDYDTLIESIGKVINNEEVIINNKFDINVPIIELSYTFYVLSRYLFGKRKNTRFLQFIKDAILQFENWDFDVFKAKISTPPNTFSSYIPQIIKDQRIKQK
jgi:hypothetical protein